MRVLIPYDGTKNAEKALFELNKEEFGNDDEILVVITDVFMADSFDEFSNTRRKRRLEFESSGTASYIPSRWKFEEERFLVNKIQNRLSTDFPELNIKVETLPGYSLVSSELMEKARKWKADFILKGKQKKFVKPDKESLNGKQVSKIQNASYDAFKMKQQKVKSSVQTVSSTELFKEEPTQAAHRLVKPNSKIKKFTKPVATAV